MKKMSILLLVVLIMLLVGCSNGNKVDSGTKETETKGYLFETKDVTIAMHAEVEPILSALGDNMGYFEAESCAFQGLERIYSYSGFDLHTYELEGVDYVAIVIFTDDSVSTKEGISLNASLEDVINAYGDKYVENLGVYSYELGKMKLTFMIENDEVTSIEYVALAE